MEKVDLIYKVRHSLAHVMAQAVMRLRPDCKLGFGPPTKDGFYYDFVMTTPITEKDLQTIEGIMREIIDEDQVFSSEEISIEDSLKNLEATRQSYKLIHANDLVEREALDTLMFYTNGPFTDMCRGPHVESTGKLRKDCFALDSIAGAYWKGNEKNTMMTRIYGLAFLSSKELRVFMAEREKRKANDHRKLNKDLHFYSLDDTVGKGLVLWHENGAIIRHELEKLAYELEFKAGYKLVSTPHIAREELYLQSGHLPYYKDSMYPPIKIAEGADETDLKNYYLKPMNCPHHHRIFASRLRSYREMPLRLAEYGTVYRYEKAGQLQGLTRVRGMAINDAHIYCSKDQVKEEFKKAMLLHKELYDLFGLKDYYMRLSLSDRSKDKYIDDNAAWDYTEQLMKEAMDELNMDYVINYGDAAFYGPKVDIQFYSAIKKEFTLSTNQLDFASAGRLGLQYTGSDGNNHKPYIIHRAPLGTHERFIAFLIEHYGGAFPLWLAPVQIKILPLTDKQIPYASAIAALLKEKFIRTAIDHSSEQLSKKIRTGITTKIPILAIIGPREEEEQKVQLRRYGVKQQESLNLDGFIDKVVCEIKGRQLLQS